MRQALRKSAIEGADGIARELIEDLQENLRLGRKARTKVDQILALPVTREEREKDGKQVVIEPVSGTLLTQATNLLKVCVGVTQQSLQDLLRIHHADSGSGNSGTEPGQDAEGEPAGVEWVKGNEREAEDQV